MVMEEEGEEMLVPQEREVEEKVFCPQHLPHGPPWHPEEGHEPPASREGGAEKTPQKKGKCGGALADPACWHPISGPWPVSACHASNESLHLGSLELPLPGTGW